MVCGHQRTAPYRAFQHESCSHPFHVDKAKRLEVMRVLRKGQAAMFSIQGGIIGEARIVERAFGIGPYALTEAMTLLQDHLASADA